MAKKERPLTPKQLNYCRERAKGKSYAKAYADAGYGPNASNDHRTHNAYTLEHLLPVSERIQKKIAELNAIADQGAILDRRQRQAMLSEIALNTDNDMPDRLRATDQLNRMAGDYTDRLQAEGAVKLSYADRISAMRQANGETESASE